MEAQKKEDKKDIIVLDEGMETDVSGDPVRAWICCIVMFIGFRS